MGKLFNYRSLVREEAGTASLKMPTKAEGLLDLNLTQDNYPLFTDQRL